MKKKITCKHSAARTAVEQACDVGPMFKITKGVVKTMPTEPKSISPISFRISSILNELASTDPLTSGRVVILASHKKKAIIAGISKLPVAMAAAFKEGHIQSAFKSNGQINKEGIIPDVHALAGTYRASITSDHYLKDTTPIIKSYYKEMYLTGRIEEASFDKMKIIRDTDSKGNEIRRDFAPKYNTIC